jgi:hypothetical protein
MIHAALRVESTALIETNIEMVVPRRLLRPLLAAQQAAPGLASPPDQGPGSTHSARDVLRRCYTGCSNCWRRCDESGKICSAGRRQRQWRRSRRRMDVNQAPQTWFRPCDRSRALIGSLGAKPQSNFGNALLRELKMKKIASRQIPNARIALPVLAAGLFVGMATGHAQAPSQHDR